jgi:hypothetical protein
MKMTYPELMTKIVKLPGWAWEWKLGDKAWMHYMRDIVLICGILPKENGLECVLTPVIGMPELWCQPSIGFVPLPTIEQFDAKFDEAGYDFEMRRCGDSYVISAIDRDTRYRHEDACNKSILMQSISELYARVVLGYELRWGEFVKC